jgi:hypothetical protein
MPTLQKSTIQKNSSLLALMFVIFVLLACRSGSSSECTATLTYEGKSFTGAAKSKEEATRNACNHYCREADPGYEAMYRIWLDSPEGKAAGRPSKKEAIFKDEKLMDYVTVTCANKCLDNIKDGKNKVETKCD